MPSFARPSGGRRLEPLTLTMEAGYQAEDCAAERRQVRRLSVDCLFRLGQRAVFVYGFAKNERDNIDAGDERDFKRLAKILLAVSDSELNALVDDGKYVEIECDGKS